MNSFLSKFDVKESCNAFAFMLVEMEKKKKIYLSLRNNPSKDTNNAVLALVSYKAQDEAHICNVCLCLLELMKTQEVWDDWDPQADDYHSLRNNPNLDTDDAGVALVGYKAQDEARICRFFAQSGTCWKSYCRKEHSMPNPGLLSNHFSPGVKQILFQ